MEKYKVGEDVVYNNHRWTIESIERDKMHGINPETGARIVEASVKYRLARLRRTPSCVFELVWTMAPEEQIESVPHELTAKEYAEKLKAVLGYDNCKNIDGAEPEDEVCAGLDLCEKCPFYLENREAVFEGSCEALMLYHPDLAMKLMDEWQAEKNKPKGKTYLQDFVEKLPRTAIGQGGIPFVCLKNVYGEEASADDVCKAGDCKKCWGQKMPEEDNAEG